MHQGLSYLKMSWQSIQNWCDHADKYSNPMTTEPPCLTDTMNELLTWYSFSFQWLKASACWLFKVQSPFTIHGEVLSYERHCLHVGRMVASQVVHDCQTQLIILHHTNTHTQLSFAGLLSLYSRSTLGHIHHLTWATVQQCSRDPLKIGSSLGSWISHSGGNVTQRHTRPQHISC